MSWQAHLLTRLLRLIEKPQLRRADDPERLRRSFALKSRLLFHPPRGTVWKWFDLAPGLRAIDIGGDWVKPGKVILYFHGGGYIFGSPRTHMAMLARMSRAAQTRVVAPAYPMAPEHPFPAATRASRAAYAALGEQDIILGGDSAGGGLCLSLLGQLLRDQAHLPSGVFAFSPLTDLTLSGQSFKTNARRDPLLPASRAMEMSALYLADADPTDPLASPLFADFKGAPPVWLAVDETEILLDDTLRLESRLHQAGVPVTLQQTNGLPHVWPLFHNYLPEGRSTLNQLGRWINSLSPVTGES